MLEEVEGDCRSRGTWLPPSPPLHTPRVEKSRLDADDEILRSFLRQVGDRKWSRDMGGTSNMNDRSRIFCTHEWPQCDADVELRTYSDNLWIQHRPKKLFQNKLSTDRTESGNKVWI